MTITRTVAQCIAASENRGEEMVAEAYGVVEVNDPTVVEDAISDLLHLLESIHGIQGVDPDEDDDARGAVLRGVRRAIGHWYSESVYAETNGDEPSEVLGGIPIYEASLIGVHLTDH